MGTVAHRTQELVMRTHRTLAVAGLVAALVAAPSLAGATLTDTDPAWHTGCLRASGVIVKVAPGNTPRQPCTDTETRIDLNNGDLTHLSSGPGIQLRKGATIRSGSDRGATGIELNPAYQLPQGCAPGTPAVRATTGTTWTCGRDDVGRAILAHAKAPGGRKAISNSWGSLTRPMRLPAGTWAVTARIGFNEEVTSPDDFHLTCRLVTEGSVTDAQTIHFTEPSGVLAWYGQMVLVGVVSRPTPMDLHVQCNDDLTEGAAWNSLRITATEASGIEVQDLG
jgi:hypothetical protein